MKQLNLPLNAENYIYVLFLFDCFLFSLLLPYRICMIGLWIPQVFTVVLQDAMELHVTGFGWRGLDERSPQHPFPDHVLCTYVRTLTMSCLFAFSCGEYMPRQLIPILTDTLLRSSACPRQTCHHPTVTNGLTLWVYRDCSTSVFVSVQFNAYLFSVLYTLRFPEGVK